MARPRPCRAPSDATMTATRCDFFLRDEYERPACRMMLALFVSAALGYQLLEVERMRIEGTSARTIIRCWHRLHVERLKTHSFADLLAPHEADSRREYHGAVRLDEVRAIAVVEEQRVVGVAHGFDELAAASALVVALKRGGADLSAADARWQCEAMFEGSRRLPPAYEEGSDPSEEAHQEGDTSVDSHEEK